MEQDYKMLNRRITGSIVLLGLLAFSFVSSPQPVLAGGVIQVSAPPKGQEFAPDDYNESPERGCSLREAIVAANTNKAFGGCPAGNGADTILIPAGKYRLTINNADSSGEDQAKAGDLDVRDDTFMVGAGSGNGGTLIFTEEGVSDRVFEIMPPKDSQGKIIRGINVAISNLKISSGFVATNYGGGGILNNGANLDLQRVVISENIVSPSSVGGGITNISGSKLTINNSTISSNSAGYGGGIYNGGKMVITNSLIFSNTASTAGGGIDNVPINLDKDTVSITNSTIAFNSAVNAKGAGGGIANSGPFTLINSTIVDNVGAGLFLNSASMTVRNSIIARNLVEPNCASTLTGNGKLVSNGYNLIGDVNPSNTKFKECSFKAAGDLMNEDPLLTGTLGNNGGSTQTYKFTSNDSPAIDKIPVTAAACPSTDQRGYTRPGGKLCDIGAYESGAVAPVLDKKVFLPLVVNP